MKAQSKLNAWWPFKRSLSWGIDWRAVAQQSGISRRSISDRLATVSAGHVYDQRKIYDFFFRPFFRSATAQWLVDVRRLKAGLRLIAEKSRPVVDTIATTKYFLWAICSHTGFTCSKQNLRVPHRPYNIPVTKATRLLPLCDLPATS